jgi:glycosyltransferase involved in cell wall biosynthesis
VSVLNYTSGEMKNALAELPDARGFDLVHLDSIHMLRYAEQLGRAKVVYNWHNIESELMRRYGQTIPSAARRLYASHTAKKLEALERHILASAFGHIVCSEREREQLQRLAPKARIAVVENGVDTLHFAGNGGAPEKGALETKNRIVYVGKMDYHPNVEAVTEFVRDIWPTIHERMPSLKLCIVGADPPPVVTALRETPGVEVTGTVPDVSPYYRGSLASIVPLRTGGGTRLKILEAMAAGTPVISTEVGAEGLAVTPGRDILIVDAPSEELAPVAQASSLRGQVGDLPHSVPASAEAWLDHLTLLAGSPERRAQITAAGLDLVRSRYDWARLGQQLWSTYEGWLRSAD